MLAEGEIKKYLKKYKAKGLDVNKSDILFLSSMIENIINNKIDEYKKKVKNNNISTKAVIYCRVSSKKQELEGSGLENQEKRCRQYCDLNNYEVSETRIFRDSFTGGGDFMQRPAMKELFDFLDNKSFDNYTIIFDDIKRLARDAAQYFRLRSEFKARGLWC